MDTFFPSEIARLVLGYLKEDKCLKSWQTFLEESSNLREYFSLFKKGKVYPTNVNGCSLLDILNEYSALKFEALNKDPKIESECSESIETLKEENIIESTQQTVDSVFQKYLSPSDDLKEDNVSPDLSLDVCELPNPNNCSSEEIKKHCTDVAEHMSIVKSDHCCDQQIAISAKNIVNNRNKNYKHDKAKKTLSCQRNKKFNIVKEKTDPVNHKKTLRQSRDLPRRNTPPDSLTSFIQSLSDKLNKKESLNLPNFVQHRCDTKDNSLSLIKPKPPNEDNAVSSTETVLIEEDDDIEIVEEIKKEDKCFDNLSSMAITGCSNNISAKQKATDNIVNENTQINEPRHKNYSLNNSNVEDLQSNSLKNFKIEQIEANNQNKINEPEPKTDSSANRVCYVDSGTFIQPSTTVNEMSFSYPQNYILPSYTPNSSFTNNAPVYVVLNTSGAPCGSVINGTILTVPSVQSNTVPCPVSSAVSTTFVNNSITASANNFASSLPNTNIVSNVDEVSLSSVKVPQNDIFTAPSVGQGTTSKEKNVSDTKVYNKVLRKSSKTYSKESQTSEVSKRRSSSSKKDQKKKVKGSLLQKDLLIPAPEADISSLFESKGGHSKS